MLGKLVSLAEVLGTVRTENPEQDSVGVAFRNSIADVVEAVEASLGFTVDFPHVGAAYGIEPAGRLLPPETPEQIYAALRLRAAVEAHVPAGEGRHVVEIGGGYGAMAYWFLRMMDVRYTVVDLPIINVLQGYFLAEALGHDNVSLLGEPPRTVTVVPNTSLDAIQMPVSAVANKDSMPEIPEPAVVDYLEWTKRIRSAVFWSYNQEAAFPVDGTPQTVVPEVVARVGGLTRVDRELSFLRRGYAIETYDVDR
ncbi:MAG TPA: hypothetical protein VH025_03205 [Solirubrobacteraceae bacterium]|nr:hypothetical protein [Solirubrobacteraceae bacterium]